MNEIAVRKLRSRQLILEGTPCDVNLYPGGPCTIGEAKSVGPSLCPHFDKCKTGLNEDTGYVCIMKCALEVAKNVIKEGSSVSSEVHGDFKREFLTECSPPDGFVYSADRKDFVFIRDKREVLKKVEDFAAQVLGVEADHSAKPSQIVGPNFEDIMSYATTSDGAIDLRRVDRLEGRFAHLPGRNRRCDVAKGPCACGAWH